MSTQKTTAAPAGNNLVQLTGKVTTDITMGKTDAGVAFAHFRMETKDDYEDEEGEIKEAKDFHYIQAWGKLAHIVKSKCKSGRKVSLRGKLKTNSYEDDDGVKKYSTKVVIDRLKA